MRDNSGVPFFVADYEPWPEERMPMDENEVEETPQDDSGVRREENQRALIFVRDRRRGANVVYDGMILYGTKWVLEEVDNMSMDVEEHPGLIVPQTRGLWIWEGNLVFASDDSGPQWEGNCRSITIADYKTLGI